MFFKTISKQEYETRAVSVDPGAEEAIHLLARSVNFCGCASLTSHAMVRTRIISTCEVSLNFSRTNDESQNRDRD